MQVISLFSGAGGLDSGFEQAGFEVVLANEYDSSIWTTYRANFGGRLDTRSIVDIPDADFPEVDGLIGGPPCQSWSEAGARRGIDDRRGQLFFEYIRVLKRVRPRFFLAENVSGIVSSRHADAFSKILEHFRDLGYEVSFKLLNSADYGVPQDRERVIVVGFRSDLGLSYEFPSPSGSRPTLRDAIGDLRGKKPAGIDGYGTARAGLKLPNHEFVIGGFSPIFMSRNRVRSWDEQSFTIQAGARHVPIHPQAPVMERVAKDQFRFVPGKEHLYRRLSVLECARIQTFPDTHRFIYDRIGDGYKMIGNAVPVEFARRLAESIKQRLSSLKKKKQSQRSPLVAVHS